MAKRKAVNIKDVARESNASLTTVSLVLNKRDERISSETRERILATVDRLGYRPSRIAQGLQSQRSGFIAILVPQIRHAFADVYFGELISAIHESANEAGYKVMLEVANAQFIGSRQHLELFDRHYVDGILCMGITNNDDYVCDFEDGARASILVNTSRPGNRLNYVRCNYRDAGAIAGRYLLELGHRRIAMIHGAREVQTSIELQQGFTDALKESGVKLLPRQLEDGLYTEEGGAAAALALMKRDPSLTAIFVGNDKMAIGAISSLKQSRRRVPQDVSVVGCDDIHQAVFCDPPLTTVHTPIFDVGKTACCRLFELIEGKIKRVEETHPVRMTVRQSAVAPRQP